MAQDEQREQLISWLKNAYGMEKSQLKMLDRFIKDFDDDAEIKSKLEEHKEVTESQRDRLETCLESFDESPSKIKEATGSMMGMMQGMGTSAAPDEKIKDLILIHAGEHLEHASYMGIKEAAERLGESEVAQVAAEIAEEEMAVADWAEQQLPKVIEEVMTA